MCISAHSALGKGVQTRKKRKLDHQLTEQQLNYAGATHVTRYLMATLPKQYYEAADSQVFERLLEELSKDIGRLSREGLLCEDTGLRYWISPLCIKGDWPFLHKVAGLERSFYSQPKRERAARPCRGICHFCLAGRDGIPFEDCSQGAEWQYTMGIEKPWSKRPVILDFLTHDPTFEEIFFMCDPWHTWHLGEGRNLACNCIKLLLDITPGRNVDVRLAHLFTTYREFCRRARVQCYANRFSSNLFGLVASDFPTGSWTKGNFTTSLVKWLADYLSAQRNNFVRGSLLDLAAPFMNK